MFHRNILQCSSTHGLCNTAMKINLLTMFILGLTGTKFDGRRTGVVMDQLSTHVMDAKNSVTDSSGCLKTWATVFSFLAPLSC